jgi:DNA polymerase I
MATFFEMRGTKEIAVFNTPTFVLSHNFKTGKSEFNQINEIIRHLSGKKVYTYRSVNGVTRVTEDHSLIDDLGNEFKPTEMKDAKKVKVCKYNKKLDGKIDLFAYIGSYSYLSRKMRTLVAVGDKVLFEDNENRFFDRYLDVLDESRVKSLLRLTAHYICNGSSSTPETTKSRLGASIASENEVLINQLRDDYAEWFHGYNVNVLPPDYSQRSMNNGKWNIVNRCFKLQMMNALSAVIFKQMCGQKYHGKKIPDFVYMLDEKYQRYFLSLLIDGDGTVEKKSIIEDQFRFETGSLKLISGISLICDILEIKTAILYKAKQRTYTIRSREKDSNAWLVKKSCNEEEYGGYVYDLSVANVHNFVDACGNILLHNTDSLMFVLKKESIIPTLISNIHKVCAQHAKKFGCKTCTLDMAYDKGFRKFVILAKKRYAGTLTYLDGRILEVPKLYVAGLEYKRTDQCQMVRKKQEELLNLILNPDRMLGVEEARDFIDKLKQYVLSGEVSIEEITFSQKITKTLDEYEGRHMHKMVAQEMMADGKEVWVTDKIPYFIENIGADGKPVPRPTYKFAGKFARSHYWNNKIFPPLRRVLEVVFQNVNWDSYEVGGKKASQAQQGRMGLW